VNEPPNESNPWLPTVHDNLDDAMVEIDQLRAIVQQIDQQALSAMYHVDGGLTETATYGACPDAMPHSATRPAQPQRPRSNRSNRKRSNERRRRWTHLSE